MSTAMRIDAQTQTPRVPAGTFAAIALAAIAYPVLGALGLVFAIAPGYVSPIFPAAGFATAILLSSNNRAWPGIWLGSVLLNLGVAWLHGDHGWRGVLIASGIAAGSTLQAMAARWLVRRGAGETWQRMETEGDIVRCLFLAGPVACVISATTGVTLLWWTRTVAEQEYLYSWWNWWSGDTLGVLVMLPLGITFLLRRETPWRTRLTTLVPSMVVALATVGGAFYAVAQWERSQHELAIRSHGEALARLLDQRFIAHQEALSSLRRMTEVSPEMSYAQFEYFTRITLADNPDIFALSINPYVKQAQRAAFERDMGRKIGMPNFSITEKKQAQGLTRAAERAEYVVVGYIAPLAGNRPAQGYDIHSEPVRRAAIRRAMESEQPAATAPLRLVQEDRERVGMLVLHPFRHHVAGESDGFALAGFAVGVIKIDEMVEIATRGARIPELILQVDDVTAADAHKRVYRSQASGPADSDIDARYAWHGFLHLADRVWKLSVLPTEGYLRRQSHWIAVSVGVGGLALASLLQILLLITTGKTAAVQQKVLEQTAEIHAKANVLEDRNAQLNTLFELSPDGFLLFDEQRRIKYASPAFTLLTGIDADAVIGRDENAFSDLLERACRDHACFPSVAVLRAALQADAGGESGAQGKRRQLIELAGREKRVLEIGIRLAGAATVSQILYFRDVTRETEVDRMKSEFLSHAAHELRTPMASILGYSELLLAREFTESERNEYLGTIHRQSELIVRVINELLDLARIDARRGKDFVTERVELKDVVVAMVADYKVPPGRSAPVVDLGAQSRCVMADRGKLTQALLNVLSNAYKYSPGGGNVSIELLGSEEETEPAQIGIRVRDQGIGMTPAQLSRVCERFYRADTSGKIPGTGLGMSIVSEIVELHGGHLQIASTLGAGTTVTLWLPAWHETEHGTSEMR